MQDFMWHGKLKVTFLFWRKGDISTLV